MKPWDRSVSTPDPETRERPVTREIEGNDEPPVRVVASRAPLGARPRLKGNVLKTVEIDVRRDRRATTPVPASGAPRFAPTCAGHRRWRGN